MAKIYYRKYMQRIDAGEITLLEAIDLVDIEVPERWQDAVKALLGDPV